MENTFKGGADSRGPPVSDPARPPSSASHPHAWGAAGWLAAALPAGGADRRRRGGAAGEARLRLGRSGMRRRARGRAQGARGEAGRRRTRGRAAARVGGGVPPPAAQGGHGVGRREVQGGQTA